MELLDIYKNEVDTKYGAIIPRFKRKLTHSDRTIESTLGNLVAYSMADNADTDVELRGSGSTRFAQLVPVVTLQHLKECFPYDDSLSRF